MAANALSGAVGAQVITPRTRWHLSLRDRSQRLSFRMTDERLIVLLASLLSIGFFVWYERHGLTTAFADARSRELIARRVLLSRTPGLAQLGTTWLPLLFLLMLPTIWINALFSDGLAGSLPSMLAYVVAALYIYRTARLLTSSRGAGWVAAIALMLNPSLAYMQGTPMSEPASIAAFVVAVYYGARAAQTMSASDVAKCAAAVAVGTLIRYENWALALAFLPILAYVAWRRRGFALAEAWTWLFGLLAFAGCAAWIIYNWVIFHDPLLAFFYGQRSHTFYANANAAQLPARGHAVYALKMYGLTVAETAGWVMTSLAVLGLGVFIWRRRLRAATLPVYLILIPFAFYWLAFYKGANTETMPELGTGPYYNIRFGLAMLPAIALFAAVLTSVGPRFLRFTLIAAVSVVVAYSGVSGLTTTRPFVLREIFAGYGASNRQIGPEEASWLSSHYHGGEVLYTYIGDPSLLFFLLTKPNFTDHDFVTDSNGPQFTRALTHPERWVKWIVLVVQNNNLDDKLWNTLAHHSNWRSYFVLRKRFGQERNDGTWEEGTMEFYERSSAPSLSGSRPTSAPVVVPAAARAAAPPTAALQRHALAPGTRYTCVTRDSDDRNGSCDPDDRRAEPPAGK
jgi:hypothetical protein